MIHALLLASIENDTPSCQFKSKSVTVNLIAILHGL